MTNLTVSEHNRIANAVYDKFRFVADQCDKEAFVDGRIQMAIETGANTYEEILFIALYAPLLKPNKFAIQAAKESVIPYLELVGNDDLKRYHDEILELAIEYHEHILYSSGRIDNKTTAVSHDPRYGEINTRAGFASELYHRIPLGYDWQAISDFIISDSTQHGEALQIQDKYGPYAKVYKSGQKTACAACNRAYRHNGIPRIFKVSELIANNPTYLPQRIYEDEQCDIPTSGPNHLYCFCMLHVFTGMEHWSK